ncbi:hypothetical protein GCM10020295_44190 [Streptomyces cinereospinus]
MADVDATFTVSTSQRARSDNAEQGVFASLITRVEPVSHDFYAFNIGFRADTGLPGNEGLRLAVNITKIVDATVTALNVQVSPRGLTYLPGVPVRVRVQCAGPPPADAGVGRRPARARGVALAGLGRHDPRRRAGRIPRLLLGARHHRPVPGALR